MNSKRSSGRGAGNSSIKKDVIVSVKLPQSLVNELRDLQQINHFMDLSDEMRFIVRRYCFNVLNKNLSSSKNIDNNDLYSNQIESLMHEKQKKDQVISDLTKILNNLRNSESVNNNSNNNTNNSNEQ